MRYIHRVITRLIRNVYVDGQLAVGLVGEQRDPVYNVARPNRGESTRQSDVRIHCI